MIPVIIQDYISNVLDSKTHPEKRQFYYTTLVTIKTQIEKAIKQYEIERNFRK
jgi:hypothetical protein